MAATFVFIWRRVLPLPGTLDRAPHAHVRAARLDPP